MAGVADVAALLVGVARLGSRTDAVVAAAQAAFAGSQRYRRHLSFRRRHRTAGRSPLRSRWKALVNTVAFGQFVQPVVVLATILGVFLAFAAAMRAVQVYVAEIIQRRLFVRIAGDLAHRLPRVKSEFWDRHYGPELTNRFFEVVTVQKVTTQLLLEGSSLLLQTLVGMAVIAFYHPILLGFDAFLLLFILSIIFVLGRGAVSTSVDESRQKYATAAWLEDLARYPSAFTGRSGMAFAVEETDRRVAGYLSARVEHFRILMRQVVASLALQVIASTVLLGIGGWLVIRGELSLGQLVAAELIVTVIVGSFAKIGKFLEGYYDVMASMDKLGHLFDMPIERLDGVETAKSDEGMSISMHAVASPPTPSGQRLQQVSLTMFAGEQVAIAGGSAALRRRLLDVIIGRVEPTAGRLELDGMDARRLCLESLRDQSAFVSGPEIFQGTIAENIHLGRPTVREQDLIASLQAVGLWDELLALPAGLRATFRNGKPIVVVRSNVAVDAGARACRSASPADDRSCVGRIARRTTGVDSR